MQLARQTQVHRFILAALILLMTGCQYVSFPGVYKIDVQQGNIITQDMIDQLQPGMTKRQVRYIMGNPLVQDTFNPNRWDYYYSMKAADDSETKERVTIVFEEDKLVSFSGDYVPSNAVTPAP